MHYWVTNCSCLNQNLHFAHQYNMYNMYPNVEYLFPTAVPVLP